MLKRINSELCETLRNEFKTGRFITVFDAEIILNIALRNAREHLKVLYFAKEIHIAEWRRDATVGPWTPVYVWGRGEDAAKPRPLRRVWVRD